MSATKSASLTLQEEAADWLMQLHGDWSLTGAPQIQAQLDRLPAPSPNRNGVTCDWSGAARPGIASAWMLLTRLIDLGFAPAAIKHVGSPPHYLELLKRLGHERHVARTQQTSTPILQEVVGGLGY